MARKSSPRADWLKGFYAQECCGVPMQTGYDVMTFACRHSDYEQVTECAYFAMCEGQCSTSEVLCSKCVDEAVNDAR
jgi:hypothetical protein